MEPKPAETPDACATGPSSAAKHGANPWRELIGNLACGARAALFRRVAPDDFDTGARALVFLVFADQALNLAVSFLLVRGGGELNLSALPSFLFHLPLMLLCGFVAGRLMSRNSLVTLLPVALISLSIPIELCHGVLEGVSQLPRLAWLEDYLEAPHYFRFFWWWTAAALLFLLRLRPATPGRRFLLAVLFAATITLPLFFYPRGDLWAGPEEGGESGELRLTEEVVDAQAHLLDDQSARLLPAGKEGPELYFIGFAGDASQDVFMRELVAVDKLFSERFGTAGRSVLLANNPRSATALPFATAGNLERAIKRAGEKMNRDRDVLFLYLTSHGSEDNVLAVENGPLELDGVTPEMVRRMLQRSGVTWKVIAVSACYAGGFIEPLKDDHTLIITAADAVHESFGCSAGEEYTWFGKAYFKEALAGTYSFTDAFGKARETIGKWEKEQGETPSNPQMWVGREMKGKLVELEKRLERVDKRSAPGR
ncbi:MAG TPA: C13 family peptidase [Geobacteraceae bacterium]